MEAILLTSLRFLSTLIILPLFFAGVWHQINLKRCPKGYSPIIGSCGTCKCLSIFFVVVNDGKHVNAVAFYNNNDSCTNY